MDIVKTIKLTEEEKGAIKVLHSLTSDLYKDTQQCKNLLCHKCPLNIFCVNDNDIENDDSVLNLFIKELNKFIG